MHIEEQVPLAPLTTMGVGGTAQYFVRAETDDEIIRAIAYARDHDLSWTVFAGGSNVIIPDEGINGLVIHVALTGVSFVEDHAGARVIAKAGENWDGVVAACVERGLGGIENLSGIPGSAGAAPVQNIGAYGVELADVFEWLQAIDTRTDDVVTFSRDDCHFGYRDSIFKRTDGSSYIITRLALRLSGTAPVRIDYKDLAQYFQDSGEPPTREQVRNAVLAIRARKFPDWHTRGTAGSFFKNPVITKRRYTALRERYPELPGHEMANGRIKLSAAWILDRVCDLRGYRAGNVELFEKQPLVLVNYGGATADEIERFAAWVNDLVNERTGLTLDREVRTLTPRSDA